MIKSLLLLLAFSWGWIDEQKISVGRDSYIPPIPNPTAELISKTKIMLESPQFQLSPAVVSKVLDSLACAHKQQVEHNHILTIIDYSLPSSQKRLWIFDLKAQKLLFYTYVSHGINSGYRLSQYFSNQNNSKSSSLGIYRTEQSYYGREGLSLRLEGLDSGFNDNAMRRYIVMHAGWYVDENFIKKYGRAGRSWGCPAVPVHLTKDIINTIKEKSFFVIYYPQQDWLAQSRFLNCAIQGESLAVTPLQPSPEPEEILKDKILFADLNQNQSREENEPLLVMAANHYQLVFHKPAPLTRMLRRQVNQMEYIAVSAEEFKQLFAGYKNLTSHLLQFVVPDVQNQRGYYKTFMKLSTLGQINKLEVQNKSSDQESFQLQLDAKPAINIYPMVNTIRWLGL